MIRDGISGQAAPPARQAERHEAQGFWPRHRRWLTAVISLVAIALLYVAYLAQSRAAGTDADAASNVLQAWDMLHGNLALHGWWLSDVSFYTTELPEYMLVELARGLDPGVINLAGAATYTALVVLAALVAKGRATGTAARWRVLIAAGIMLAPSPGFGVGSLLSTPDHTGTQVLLLLAWLAIDRLGDRRYLPWLVGALLSWDAIADQMTVYVGAVPLIIVSVIRLARRRGSWKTDAGLLAAAAVSIVAATAGPVVIRLAGGYHVASVSAALAPAAHLQHHAWLMLQSVLTLFGADFTGVRSWPAIAAAAVHLAGVILVAWACCLAGRRVLAAQERLVPILFTGILINLAAFLFSTLAVDRGSTHELAAVLPFGAALAGRLIPEVRGIKAARPVLLAVLAGYAAGLAFQAAAPPRPPATQAVASWLAAHQLTDGVGTYWTANITTVATGGQISVRPVRMSCGRFIPYAWEARPSWYEPPASATFMVLALTRSTGANGTAADAVRQFGPPRQTAQIGGYEVLVWNHDLLPALTSGIAPGCGPRWQQ